MENLDDLYYFACVVERRGFAAASRALDIPKSRLSRRISDLERRLGVRLLQRTSRSFAVTDLGAQFYKHCQIIVAEATRACVLANDSQTEPAGVVRISCPSGLGRILAFDLLPELCRNYPKLRPMIRISGLFVNLLDDGIDIALRASTMPLESSGMVSRTVCKIPYVVVASPRYLAQRGTPQTPEDLLKLDHLVRDCSEQPMCYSLFNTEEKKEIHAQAFMRCDDLQMLKALAISGIGVTALPKYLCQEALSTGALVTVLPAWKMPDATLYLLFPSREGLALTVRACIDYLLKHLPKTIHSFSI
jgi:DNA-binding transcriptional LysR family regulator